MKYKTDKELMSDLPRTDPEIRVMLHAIFKAPTTDAALTIVRELRAHSE